MFLGKPRIRLVIIISRDFKSENSEYATELRNRTTEQNYGTVLRNRTTEQNYGTELRNTLLQT